MDDRNERYRSFSRYLGDAFGERVHKIALDAGFSCPNLDGAKGRGGCTYCDANGSGPGPRMRGLSVRQQIVRSIEVAERRRPPVRKFLAYFQARTNTYAPAPRLRVLYDEALDHPQVVGLDVSTRPDCVPDDVLDLLAEYAASTHLWLELGLQSASDDTLRRINRGHGTADFADAVRRAHERGLRVAAHVIFGFPWETREMMMATIDLVASLGVEGVKLHSLYLVPGTPLHADAHCVGISQDEYAALAADALERLPPETVVLRLTGDPPPGIAPDPPWTGDKQATIGKIVAELQRRGTRQGSRWGKRATRG